MSDIARAFISGYEGRETLKIIKSVHSRIHTFVFIHVGSVFFIYLCISVCLFWGLVFLVWGLVVMFSYLF